MCERVFVTSLNPHHQHQEREQEEDTLRLGAHCGILARVSEILKIKVFKNSELRNIQF